MKPLFLLVPLAALFLSCDAETTHGAGFSADPDSPYRQEMRDFVIGISQKARAERPGFIVIPQNGIELVSRSADESETPDLDYLNAIDGNGQEDLFYGYDNDNKATPADATAYLRHYLDISKQAGKAILVTDYCSSPDKIADSGSKNNAAGYVSYAAGQRLLNLIPDAAPRSENRNDITRLGEAKNFLYLIDPDTFPSKQQFLACLSQTNYDAVIIDLFLDGQSLTASEVARLRQKANGGKRLVICYMSIGEAEDYRYYWNPAWTRERPSFLEAENRHWSGNFKVRYWEPEWQAIIYGNADSYLSRITAAGFDGVYLDIIDGYEYFEN